MADVLQYRRFEPMMLIPTRASGHDGPNNPPEPWPGPRPEPVPPEPPPTDPFPLEPEPPAPPPSTPDRRPSRPSRGVLVLSLSVLEELNRPLVLLRGASGLERTEVPPPATFGVDLSRVEAILARFQLTNHAYLFSITGKAARTTISHIMQAAISTISSEGRMEMACNALWTWPGLRATV